MASIEQPILSISTNLYVDFFREKANILPTAFISSREHSTLFYFRRLASCLQLCDSELILHTAVIGRDITGE